MRAFATVLLLAALLGQTRSYASDAATTAIAVTVQVSARTSLRLSSEWLQFDVADPAVPATAAVDFSAAARTRSGADVMLSVESTSAVRGPGGAADVETAVTFSGEGLGTASGSIDASAPAIAGRWSGSGLRTGRLVFSLRAAAAGTYTLPVRFVLSIP